MKEDTLHSRIILLLGLAGFMVVADNWVASPILPAIMPDLHSDLPKAGLLITAYMILVIGLLGALGGIAAATGGAPVFREAVRVCFWSSVAMVITAEVGKFFGATI